MHLHDCILYYGEFKDFRACPTCKHARYKRGRAKDKYKLDDESKTRIPFKVVWYLPLITRLRHLFANPREAKRLWWHHDGAQWELIDNKFEKFAKDPRSIKLGECTDRMNPFGDMSTNHSTWPVLLCIYNLAPWLCMKKKYIMMSMIIRPEATWK